MRSSKRQDPADPERSAEKSAAAEDAVSRRTFLALGAKCAFLGGAGPLFVPRAVLGGPGHRAPSDRLAIAAVGVGGMGQNYLAACEAESIVALCDVDQQLAGKVFQRYPEATRHSDFRRMFDKEASAFDAVIVGTPDHTHAVILMAAIALGKHIYCAKPITHSLAEARKVRKALLEAKKLVTKTSAQSSGTEGARATTELLTSGAIGAVREVHIWCDHPVYPCSLLRPKEAETPPEGFDWELWLGPAPYRPYHSAYHPWRWRPWWDFGTGTVGDMCCHSLHVFIRELRLERPAAVYGYGSVRREGFFEAVPTPECQSHANMVTWEYPARGDLPPLQMHWYDGGLKPHRPPELDRAIAMPPSGLLFVGEKGKLLAGFSGGNVTGRRGPPGGLLLPEAAFRDVQQPPKTLPRVPDHYGEWTKACKTGARTVCPVDFGCEMTELGLLGALALRMGGGRVLEWDAEALRITNDDAANAYVDPPYRPGWSL